MGMEDKEEEKEEEEEEEEDGGCQNCLASSNPYSTVISKTRRVKRP